MTPMTAAPTPLPPARDDDGLFVRNLLDAPHEVIYFKDLEGRILRVSRGFAELRGLQPDDLVGLTDLDLFEERHARASFADEQRIIATGAPMLEKEEWQQAEGGDVFVMSSKFPLRDETGRTIGTFGFSRDVTARVLTEREGRRTAASLHAANAQLSLVESQLRAVLDGTTDVIARYNRGLRYRYINPAGERMHGLPLADLRGRTDREVGMSAEVLAVWEPALQRVLDTARPEELEFWLGAAPSAEAAPGRHAAPTGRWHHTRMSPDVAADGAVVGVLAATRDITDLKQAQEALGHQATHDPLTGLANRHLLVDRIGTALARLSRAPGRLSLYFVDLDGFKAINDTHGHERGDRVLVEVADRLTALVRRGDTVARLGGDEFVVLCESTPDPRDTTRLGDRFVAALAEPYRDGETSIVISASIGAAVTSSPGATPSALLSAADGAMYRAKGSGSDEVHVLEV